MSKPYLEADFAAQIVEDRSWRLKEMSDLKSAIRKADSNLQRALLRGIVTICYAHWEGHIRHSARKYLEHIALRKFQYREIDRQFLRNYFLPRLAALSVSKTSIADRCALLDEILSCSEKRFSRVNTDLVNTKSNLNFDVFTDICLVCSVDVSMFSDEKEFIDLFLLRRRNEIAHGEDTFVEIDDLDDLVQRTMDLMRGFDDALENRVYLKSYKMA